MDTQIKENRKRNNLTLLLPKCIDILLVGVVEVRLISCWIDAYILSIKIISGYLLGQAREREIERESPHALDS